jgi:hypothetical protein
MIFWVLVVGREGMYGAFSMTTKISWWIIAAFVAAVLAGGALRLGLARSWVGLGGVVLLAIPATLAGWNEGWRLEAVLAATAGAMALGAMLPDLLRGAAQGVVRLVQWAVPIVVGFVALAYLTQTVGPDRVGELIANLIVIAILAVAIRSWLRPRRQNHRR